VLLLPEVPIFTTPSGGQPCSHVILMGQQLGGDTMLIQALHMHAVKEEGAHGRDVTVGSGEVQRGGAG